MIHSDLQSKLPEISTLFKKNGVRKAYAFGSVCTDRFNGESDVDFLISFQKGLDPLEEGEYWWKLYYALQDLLKRDVDLVTEDSLSNPYFIKVMNQTKTTIYE